MFSITSLLGKAHHNRLKAQASSELLKVHNLGPSPDKNDIEKIVHEMLSRSGIVRPNISPISSSVLLG